MQCSVVLCKIFHNKQTRIGRPLGIHRIKPCAQFNIIGCRVVHVLHFEEFELAVAVCSKVLKFLAGKLLALCQSLLTLIKFGTLFLVELPVGAVLLNTRMYVTFAVEHGVGFQQFATKDVFAYQAVEVVKLVKIDTRIALDHFLDKFLIVGLRGIEFVQCTVTLFL